MTAPTPRLAPAVALALLAVLVASARPARADIFSPGELSRAHSKLEGLSNCTKCHAAGDQLSPEHCMACHKEIQARVLMGKGFHGLLPPDKRACQTCHHEHQGTAYKLIDWGSPGRKGFDHAKAGWPLEGKHKPVDCAKCHDPRHVNDVDIRKALEAGRASYLGTPTACGACHFDEHRGQVGAECARCHTATAWKPATRFDHARTAYRLDGKHLKVACAKCHAEQQAAPVTDLGPRTPPVRPTLQVRYKPIPFQLCNDCHKDPHQGRFGGACASCHVTADWKQIQGAGKEKVFHEKTRYPLRGAHLTARCDACHGPFPGSPAVYRNMTFGKCTDCHFDAHLGQLAAAPAAGGAAARTCDRCHGLEGYLPARFEVEDHDKLAYRLEGAHRVVACAGCHPKDPRLEARLTATARQRLEERHRAVKPSLALLQIPKNGKDCRVCHRDPHGGQFQPRVEKEGCTACHGLESWRKTTFDHQKDSRFKLEGKHEKAACASCHRPGDAGVVRYKPQALACAGCHADPHAGQLAVKGSTDCARCHDAASWKEKLRFDHGRDSRFKLEGKHKPLACEKCHAVVTISKGVEARRYKPLPLQCEGCHADFHKGAFRGFQP